MWNSIAKQVLGDVAKNVWKSKKLGYDSTKMAAQWNNLYPDFNSSSKTDFYTLYGDWSSEISAANKAALEASNIQAEKFSSEQNDVAAIQKVVDDANTKQSQIAVADAANRVALANLDEMRKLRQLQISQNTAQTTYLQGKSEEGKKGMKDAVVTEQAGPDCAKLDKKTRFPLNGKGCTKKDWADWNSQFKNN